MQSSTNEKLRALPIKLLQVDFEKSTNTKSLKTALEYLGENSYDVALIIDADNIINSSYLSEVNNAFADPKVQVVQTHRVAKNLNTDMGIILDEYGKIKNSFTFTQYNIFLRQLWKIEPTEILPNRSRQIIIVHCT